MTAPVLSPEQRELVDRMVSAALGGGAAMTEARVREIAQEVLREHTPDRKLLLTIPETAVLLRVSRTTVFELFKTGALHRVKVGGSTLVAASEIDRFIAASIEVSS